MAIQLDFEDIDGRGVKYWRITNYRYIFSNGKCQIEISGWKTKAKKNAFAAPLIQRNYISETDLPNRAAQEAFVKAQPDFTGAIDDND